MKVAEAELPPGPSTPRVLQTLRFGVDPYGYFNAAFERYGDVFTMRPFNIAWVVLADPGPVSELFAHGPEDLDAGRATRGMRPFLGTRGLFMLEGEEHLERRRVDLPAFHREALRLYREIVEDVAIREIERLPLGKPVALAPHFRSIVLEVILRVVYGVEEAGRLRSLGARLRDLVSLSSDKLVLLLFGFLGPDSLRLLPSVRARLQAVNREVLAEIALRRADPGLGQRRDALSLLLCARDADGRGLSDSEVRDELLTMMVAGNETSTAGLAWAAHELARAPELQERLASDPGGLVAAVVKETLRLHTPVHLGGLRILRRSLCLGGHMLPRGAAVVVAPLVIHRREDIYPDPLAFRPERFLGPRPPSGAWVPFGGGVRRCIGAALAELELRVVLEQLVRRVKLRATKHGRERVTRHGVVLAPHDGARVVLSPR
jgi:cytochrome P450